MTIELTTEEKIGVINTHLRNLAVNKYNVQLSIMEEESKNVPNPVLLGNYNEQINQIDQAAVVLDTQLANLQASN